MDASMGRMAKPEGKCTMASIAREKKNGTRRILFVAPDGRRRTIRLGKVSQRAAESIKYRVSI